MTDTIENTDKKNTHDKKTLYGNIGGAVVYADSVAPD